jgi:thiamine-monophosphate kinase
MSDDKTRTISELGEFGLINHLTKDIKIKNKSTLKGIGDDAAVLDYQNKKIVVTTDLLVEGIHFDFTYTPLKHLGYKAAVVNFSDVYAMNAQPKQITVAIALSSKFTLKAIEELYSGIRLACENYNVDFVGGDTSSSITGLTLSITAIGECDDENIVYRNTAKVNDIVCVSGDLGGAYMGLQLLEREKQVFEKDPNFKPQLDKYDYILERQLKPEARRDIVKLLKDNNICPTSMIDISDGLSSEVLHICKDSMVGCSLYEEKIPINQQTKDMAIELNINPVVCALNGGEDYELLFTVSINDYEKIKNLQNISIIGHITKEGDGVNLITNDNKNIPITAQGWNAMEES